ncbi:carboxymuconolactone decarboxylase family protein [Leucobacter sp. GX0328]
MRPYLDKVIPEAWKAAGVFSNTIRAEALKHGLTPEESELVKVRASQMNGCAFCLNLHTEEARDAGVPQQKLDLLPAWREVALFTERDRAVLAIAEAATALPITEDASADLAGARHVLGDDAFVAAEWVAAAINAFNRISILSQHPVRERK